MELFKDTEIPYKTPENLLPLDGTEDLIDCGTPIGKNKDGGIYYEPTEKRPWLIERAMFLSDAYLKISEDGEECRKWKLEEVNKIKELFNSN